MDVKTASRLLELRKQNGFSQEGLAEKLGISRQAISKWERAEASPDTENLIALARIYKISLDELLGLEVPKTEESQRSVIDLTKETDKIHKKTPSKMRVMYPEGSADCEEIYPQSNEDKSVYQPNVENRLCNYTDYNNYTDNISEEYNNNSDSRERFGNFNASLIPEIDDKMFKRLMTFPYPIATGVLFLVLGSFYELWHPMWMLFLTIPLYYTTIPAIKYKNPNIFCYPVFVALLYLIIGFLYELWHPGWLLFTSIPFYYWVINLLLKDKSDGEENK